MSSPSSNTPVRPWWDHVAVALAWRYLCFAAMVAAALSNEPVPAATAYDRILHRIPYVSWVARHNYHIWLAAYLPLALALWRRHRDRFVAFLYTGGAVSLLRGATIAATVLGPVRGADINAGCSTDQLVAAWWHIVNPLDALFTDAPHLYLTKDLFFSGHTASTFLLLLYCLRDRALVWWAATAHVVVVATVFLSHLHYTIDVVGGWAVTYCAYAASEWIRARYRRSAQ